MKMTTVHSTQFVGKCPLGCADVYSAEFTVIDHAPMGPVLMVEVIQELIDRLTAAACTQEQLTHQLAIELGCHVTTSCVHSRFKTVCAADPSIAGIT